MTTLKAIERRYDVLTPDERFRLVMAAIARGDDADVARLRDACPRKAYTLPDGAYTDRIEGALDVFDALLLSLYEYRVMGCIDAALAGAAVELGNLAARLCDLAYRQGYEDATGGADVPDTSGRWWQDTGERWHAGAAERGAWRAPLAAFWRAGDAWARDVAGVSLRSILTAVYPSETLALVVTWADDIAGAVEPSADDVMTARASIDALWRRRAG